MNNQSFITKLVLKTGLAKSERQVPKVLLIFTALAVVVMFVVLTSGGGDVATIDINSPDHPMNQ